MSRSRLLLYLKKSLTLFETKTLYMKTLLTRKELYDLLWNTPLNKIATDYNLTIQQIKDSCHANNIPLPQVGYWSKLKYNKQPSIAILDNSIPFDHIINLQDYANKKSAHKSDISKSLEKAKKDHSLDILIRNYKEKDRNKDQKSSTIIIHTSSFVITRKFYSRSNLKHHTRFKNHITFI